MYTHKRFFIAAGLSGLWYGAIELVGYLGWYWLVVVLLALPCVLCFGLWLRLEDERELRRIRDLKPTTCSASAIARGVDALSKLAQVPKICGSCIDYQKCFRLDLCTYSGTCEFWYPNEEKPQANTQIRKAIPIICRTCEYYDRCDEQDDDRTDFSCWRVYDAL